MRLINTQTLQLHFFMENAVPPYAILSHTWENDEVSFQEMSDPTVDPITAQKQGYTKIENCCAVARKDGYKYAWVDTCCIDKTSSSELSEAINSMYNWYKKAEVCYAYLADYTLGTHMGKPDVSFRKSRWFTRGWTLQELIAPKDVVFYNTDWLEIGTKSNLSWLIEEITGIHGRMLLDARLELYSVARRMSWASKRQTTRSEDMAYCLMGLFEVNMPMLYGEGDRAFVRLQEAIMARSTDHTLFAWENTAGSARGGLLAQSPSCFLNASSIDRSWQVDDFHFTATNMGIQIMLPVLQNPISNKRLAILNCNYILDSINGHRQKGPKIALCLVQKAGVSTYSVDFEPRITTVSPAQEQMGVMTQIYIGALAKRDLKFFVEHQSLHIDTTDMSNLYLQAAFPPLDSASIMALTALSQRFYVVICAVLVFRDYLGNGCELVIFKQYGRGEKTLEIYIQEAELEVESTQSDVSHMPKRLLQNKISSELEGKITGIMNRQYWQHPKGGWVIHARLKKRIVDGERAIVLVVGEDITR